MPNPFSLKAILIVASAALLVGLGAGGLAVHAFYAPRLELLQKQFDDLAALTRKQNKGIEDLTAAGKTRARAAAKELAEAQAAAAKAETEWMLLLQRQAPEGVDACTAASALITEELAK